MSRLRSLSLGAKLNLSLLAFLLLLAGATSLIIVYGFNRTRHDADNRSNEALEQGGSLALQAVASSAAEQGGLLFEAVAELGQRASIYMESQAVAPEAASGADDFATSAAGHRFDARPDRVSDLVVISGFSAADEAVQRDIAFSSEFDTISPVLMQGFAGEVGGRNLDPIAMSFTSPNGVTRHYPPVDFHDRLPNDADFTDRLAPVQPEANPERRTIWTAPYEDPGGQGLIVTARSPVYAQDVFRGAIEVDVSMGNVFAQISGIRPTPRSFAFYVDMRGTLLEGRSFPLLNNETGTNPELSQLLDAMRSTSRDDSGTKDARLPLAGEDYYFAYTTVPGLGGTFAVAAPVSDLTTAAAGISSGIDDAGTRTLQVMLAAMAALFVLGLIAAGVLNRNTVIKPINALVATARAVGGGDLDARVPVGTAGDELTELSTTFNGMVDQLRESERALELRVEQRTRELEAIIDTSKSLASTLELEPLLENILDHLQRLVECDGAGVVLIEGGELVQLAIRRPSSGSSVDSVPFISPELSGSAIWQALERREPVIIDDVRGDSVLARAYRAQVSESIEESPVSYLRAWAAVPLVSRDRVTGMLAISSAQPAAFDERDVELTAAVAAQAAIAIENARLFEETRRQGRENETLVRADAELFRSLHLDTVLQALVDVAVDVVGVDASIVTIWDREAGSVTVRAARNLSPEALAAFKAMLPADGSELPDDIDPKVYDSYAPEEILAVMERFGMRAVMDVPIRSATGEVLGGYGVSYSEPHDFTPDERRLLLALAERANVAIQNAELYERAQRAGSLEERQRLARELHDSVSQALYGIALGTRTARLRLGDDPHNAAEPIDYVASLAQAGLAEMRALIFELRPESLEQEGLIAALEKNAASIRARYGLDVRLELMDEPDCSLAAKEALYRIAQEAMHNIVKHAGAHRVHLSLQADAEAIVLRVSDDGCGFDSAASFPGHVGLQSMSERAAKLGGSLDVASTAGEGTVITARLAR